MTLGDMSLVSNRHKAVTEIMTSPVAQTTADTSVSRATDELLENNIGSLVITDADGLIQGIVTSTDLISAIGEGEAVFSDDVAAYMSSDVTTISDTASVTDAAARMASNDIQHLPVTDESGQPVGMISATDLTGFLAYGAVDGAE